MIIATIVGVRPQFVKAAVLSPIIRKEHKEILIHTGQHFDDNMSSVFFRELGLPEPNYRLQVSGDVSGVVDVDDAMPAFDQQMPLAENCVTGVERVKVERMVRELVSVLRKERADTVLLYGDTNSTLAGVLAADSLKIPAIHVEAGERNGLFNNPEEKIRRTVDYLSSLLLCSSRQAMEHLRAEGLGDRAHYIGNLMEISFLKNIHKPWKPHLKILCACADSGTCGFVSASNSADVSSKNTDRFSESDLFCKNDIAIPDKYYLLTCHRQENANERNLTEILLAMDQAKYPVIFPVHPRNRERLLKLHREFNLSNIILTEPVGYFNSIHLIKNAVAVVTDSGGVLQEAHFAQTPYVFVLDIAKVPDNTRFDVRRLVRPQCHEIVDKLKEHQEFAINPAENDVYIEAFEDQVLQILRRFEKCI